MTFVLKLRDVIVGRSDLATRDGTHGTMRGTFRPGLGWELVEPIFALLPVGDHGASDEQRERYRKARDTLALALYASDGALVETSHIDIMSDVASPTGLVLAVRVVGDALFTPGPASA